MSLKTDLRLDDLDMNVWKSYLACLTPKQCVVVRASPSFTDEELSQSEQWYGLSYASNPLKDSLVQSWGDASVPSTLHLPSSNPYIPDLPLTLAATPQELESALTKV